MTKLGVYWSVSHRRPQDYDYFKRLNPTVVKVMDGGDVDYQWIRANLPNSLVLARIHALSEQHSDMLADPTGTGKRHAQEWAAKVGQLQFDPANTLVLGINEPRVWEPPMLAAVVPYTVAFLDECSRLGLRGGALQLGVGWPANSGTDTPPNWTPYAPVADAIKRGRHALVTHEYWADGGPGELWGWWAGRSLKCPWDVPLVIGECGIDLYVKDPSVGQQRRGWQGRMTPERYAKELAEYTARMSADRRFVGCCVFASDYANREWASFDLQPAYQAILATPVPASQPHTVHLPVVGEGPSVPPPVMPHESRALTWPAKGVVTQRFGENVDRYLAAFGSQGHNGLDIGGALGTPVLACAPGVVAWVGVDDSYGNYIRIWHETLGFHSFYAHLDAATVQAGQRVTQGQQIGRMGSTGNSTGPHLHFEIRLGHQSGYGQAAWGHSKGRVDPQTVLAVLGVV